MNKNEERDVEMSAKLAAFLTKNREKIAGYSRLITEVDSLLSKRSSLTAMIAKQSEVTLGITVKKKGVFGNLSGLVESAAAKAFVWATDTNNDVLAAVFNITTSKFNYQSKNKQLIQAQGIADELIANAPALEAHDIFAADITAITDSINECRDHAMAPGVASNSKKAATTAVKTLLVAINTSLLIIDKLITSKYSKTDPDFVNEYFNNRRVDNRGVRHTSILVKFTDIASGKAIENAVIEIPSLGKTATSNFNGIATVPKMKTGSYHINFTAAGYAPQMQDVTVARGKTVEVPVLMVAV